VLTGRNVNFEGSDGVLAAFIQAGTGFSSAAHGDETPRLSYQYLSRCFFNFLAVTVVHGRMIPLNRTTLF
jgi:hypothetical protein